MNQGAPVVTTDAVGAARGGLVKDGENGFIVPEGDTDALAEAMDRILGNYKLHEAMSNNAREHVKAWNYDAMASGFFQALEYVGVIHSHVQPPPPFSSY
jgi:glycosyltransferase involved in cell wall biosynthesis